MSFDAKVAKNGNYHDADPNVISDKKNWTSRQQQQTTQKLAESTKEEISTEVEESNDDAEDKID